MPDGGYVADLVQTAPQGVAEPASAIRRRRAWLVAVVAIGSLAGFAVTERSATSQAIALASPELTRLLRAMAGMKAMAAIGLVGLVYWRLASPVGRGKLALYALSCSVMAAGPGLIWGMAHLKLGALLLHAGLVVVAILLWRDPAMATRLEAEIARRRARLRA